MFRKCYFTHQVLGLMVAATVTFAVGSVEISRDRLTKLTGGLEDCNIRDGFQFSYTPCTGASTCTGEARLFATDLEFGPRIHLYEMRDHCEIQNHMCDPRQSFTKVGSEEDGECVDNQPVMP